ncbi:MAG: YebC/PmpR family DNA-binding transcriptional regulator, partial [Planctomycetes bacterium]|nr:YebC/PmpR family DNA-binding transcriptional regulator [Planctomycetota bacterium]
EEELFELVVEAGGEDLQSDEEGFTITTPATELEPVKKALKAKGIEWISAELEFIPQTIIEVDEETGRKIQKLIDSLEDNIDVQNVYTNHEPPESLIAEMNS